MQTGCGLDGLDSSVSTTIGESRWTTSWTSQQHALAMKKAACWGPSFFPSVWDLWVAPGAPCLVLGSPVAWNIPIHPLQLHSSGDSYFASYAWSTSTKRASHSWSWASAYITEGSKRLVCFKSTGSSDSSWECCAANSCEPISRSHPR